METTVTTRSCAGLEVRVQDFALRSSHIAPEHSEDMKRDLSAWELEWMKEAEKNCPADNQRATLKSGDQNLQNGGTVKKAKKKKRNKKKAEERYAPPPKDSAELVAQAMAYTKPQRATILQKGMLNEEWKKVETQKEMKGLINGIDEERGERIKKGWGDACKQDPGNVFDSNLYLFGITEPDVEHGQRDEDEDYEKISKPVDPMDIDFQPTIMPQLSRTTSKPIATPTGSRSVSRARTQTTGRDIDDDGPMRRVSSTRGFAMLPPASRDVSRSRFDDERVSNMPGFNMPSPKTPLPSSVFMKREISSSSNRPSATGSPALRPLTPMGGISALRSQLELLDLEPDPNRPAMIRTKSRLGADDGSSSPEGPGPRSDTEPTEPSLYEVAIEHEYHHSDDDDTSKWSSVSPSSPTDYTDIHRKMCAADFAELKCLGSGSYGTVHLVRQKSTGKLFAQKVLRKATLKLQHKGVEQAQNERQILEAINRHPFVVNLYYAFQDHARLYLILEYAVGGELFTHLQTEKMFPEDTAAFYMAEMVLALEHMHTELGVLYRDLKPENCLLDAEGHLLLTDFGLSKVAVEGEPRCNSILGTVEYMAPEVVLGRDYGTAVDWWSFGVLGCDLLTGGTPFRANNTRTIQEKILKAKPNLPFYLTPDAKDLLTKLLRKKPHERLGAKMPGDVQKIKSHRFFRKIDWKKLAKRELEPPIQPLVTDPELAENFDKMFTDRPVGEEARRLGRDAEGLGSGDEEMRDEAAEMFGGFSYVASKSLLRSGGFLGFWDN